MTTGALRSATPEQPLSSAASKLDKVTGLAVVNADNVVVGVISIRDINRLRKQVGPAAAAAAGGETAGNCQVVEGGAAQQFKCGSNACCRPCAPPQRHT